MSQTILARHSISSFLFV